MTAPQTPGREQEIRARAEAAENGWHVVPDENDPHRFEIHGDGPTHVAVFGGDPDDWDASYPTRENAEFAAHAHEDIPWLLARVGELAADRDAFRDQRNAVFATNEHLLAQVQESDSARLRVENEARTMFRADRDAAVAAAVRRALEDVAVAVDVKLTAEPSHMRASVFYEVLLLLRGMFPCNCARSGGMHEKTCLRYVEGHELLSPENALAAYRSAAVASPAREQGEEATR